MTGAFQLALTRANPEAESLATPADVFTPGSAEEDHLRRHGKYLADGGREWVSALGVVLRGVADEDCADIIILPRGKWHRT